MESLMLRSMVQASSSLLPKKDEGTPIKEMAKKEEGTPSPSASLMYLFYVFMLLSWLV